MTRRSTASDRQGLPSDAITKSHGHFATSIGTVLDRSVRIVSMSGDQWKYMTTGGIAFVMKPIQDVVDYVKHEGRTVPVVRLPAHGDTSRKECDIVEWWVSWYERWIALGDNKFVFSAAGWVVYADVCSPPTDAELVVRAEWGPFDIQGELESISGQPHWHAVMAASRELLFPPDVVDGVPKGDLSTNAHELESIHVADLIELPTTGSVATTMQKRADLFDVSGMHLAMAGWQNAAGPRMAHWRMARGEDVCKTMRMWGKEVLQYIQTQVPYIRAR